MTLNKKQQNLIAIAMLMTLLGVAVVSVGSSIYERLQGLSIDTLLAARHQIYGQQYPAKDSAVVVIAIDENTYRTPPFSDTPKVMWTPQLAKIQDAVLAAGAKLFAHDIIFSTSLESFQKGYDKPFLKSLLQGARQGKILLGKAQHSKHPVNPHPAQSLVVRHQQNIRALNLLSDTDGVIRRIPLLFDKADGTQEPSMALEIAARFLKGQPVQQENQQILLNGKIIQGSEHNAAYINFQGEGDIPTYSFADIYHCIEKNPKYLQRHFKDKVVIFGGVLDIEDRKITSKRLMTGQGAGQLMPACTDNIAEATQTHSRDSIAGVFIQASAANDLIHNRSLQRLSLVQEQILIALSVLVLGLATLLMRPLISLLLFMVFASGTLLISVISLQNHFILPALPIIITHAVVYGLLLLYRFTVADQQKRLIRKSFEHYVSPAVVEQMVEEPEKLKLSGEYFETSVVFTDLVGFTSITEQLEPMKMRQLLTEYFTQMVDVMLDNDGTLDKFIGDAMMCFYGVPITNPDHPLQATRTAWGMKQALEKLNQQWQQRGLPGLGMRIGVNSGRVVAGNMGTSTLFNYTIMGDCVNLGARLESANKFYGTHIMLGEATAPHVEHEFFLRELDRVTVKGKTQPIRIYELLGPKNQLSDEVATLGQGYSEALQFYYAGSFKTARSLFLQLQERFADAPAAAMAERCNDYLQNPPDEWDGIFNWHKK